MYGLTFAPEFVLLGTITGLVYALVAAGLVLIYRSTGVINFSFGELGALCAAVQAKLVVGFGWNFFLALPVAIALGAGLGALLELTVIRRLFRASRVVLLVATIGAAQVFFLIQLLLPLRTPPGQFPEPGDREVFFGSLLLSGKHFLAIAVVPAVVAMLAVFLTRTPHGIAIRAAADNPDAAELAGISAKRMSTLVWVIGGALAAITVVMYNPIRGVLAGIPQPSLGPGLLLRALAAALIGRLVSLPWAMAGGVVIGIVEALLLVNTSNPGAADAVLFVVILGLLIVRGADNKEFRETGFVPTPRPSPIPAVLRDDRLVLKLPWVGYGVPIAVAVALPFVYSGSDQLFQFSRVAIFALVAVSVTVLIGWAGQLSLGHFAFVGLGAMVTGALVGRGLTFSAALAFAAVAGGIVGLLVGAPAVRLRGLFLAVTTMAFAIAAANWLFGLRILRGEGTTLTVPRSSILGFDLTSQRAYYYFCLVVLLAVSVAVGHWRTTGVGRSLIAVRENEERASSLTISPMFMKLAAFSASAAIAALAGGLLAGLRVSYAPTGFGPEESLQLVAMVIIGGLGTVSGAILGAVYVVGLPALFGDSTEVALLTSGVGLLVLLLYLPGGLISVVFRARDAGLAWLAERRVAAGDVIDATTPVVDRGAAPPIHAAATGPNGRRASTPPSADAGGHIDPSSDGEGARQDELVVRDLRVVLGGRTILPAVGLRVAAGETVGLIGTNGAGKSTLMSAMSGHVPIESGSISLHGRAIAGLPAYQRSRLGLGRVFQDARLFGDLTVTESIQIALESRERSELVPSLLALPPSRRAERRKQAEAADIIDFLGLGRYAAHRIATLSTGSRRIVELACLVAQEATMLLLDEPTAGVAQREAEAFGPLLSRIRVELDASVVIIEHDIPLVSSISDRLYCLAVGEVIAEGPPDDVRNDPAVVAAYLGSDERAIKRSGMVSVDVGGDP